MGNRKHIAVCICTFRRPEMLDKLLNTLCSQETADRFSYSISVADNDAAESARLVVERFAETSPIPVVYCVEKEANISLARNAAIANAKGEFLAFIDDDEHPASDWLLRHLTAMEHFGADGVLGPVLPRFLTPPPAWIVRGGFFNRASPATGKWLTWNETRCGNVFIKRAIFDDSANRFKPEYGRGGEDVDFFRRMMAAGKRFVWCAEAPVHEVVPPERWRRSYLLKRSLVRGRAPYNQGWPVLKSFVAVPVYAVMLPVLLLFRHHLFMRYLLKECDHLGRILAFLHLDFFLREGYVSQ